MASGGKRQGSKAPAKRKSSTAPRRRSAAGTAKKSKQAEADFMQEIGLFILFCVLIFIALCIYGAIGGSLGPFIKSLFVGLTGISAYYLPVFLTVVLIYTALLSEGKGNMRQRICVGAFVIILGIFFGLIGSDTEAILEGSESYGTFTARFGNECSTLYKLQTGGGVIFGLFSLLMNRLFGRGGAIFITILLFITAILVFLGRSVLRNIALWLTRVQDGIEERREERMREREQQLEYEDPEEEARRLRREERRRELAAGHQREKELKEERAREQSRQRKEAQDAQQEERKRRREELLRSRREAEERADDARILSASASKRRQLSYGGLEERIPEQHKLDDIHEITLMENEAANAPVEEEIRAVTAPLPSYNEDISEISPVGGYDAYRDNGNVYSGDPAADYEDPGLNEAASFVIPTGANEVSAAEGSSPDEEPMPAEVKLPDESLYNTEPEPEIPFETPAETVKPAAAEKQEAVSATSKNVAASSVIPTGANADASSVIPTEANADASSVIPTGANAVSAAEGSSPAKKKEYEKPPLDLLKESKKSKGIENELEIQELKKQLVDTLKSFGVSAEVMAVSQGPSVTRFELKLGEGIKVNKIVNLADDLKLNLAAEEIRIEAPIPGKAAVGIEIPNKERIPVSLRELIGSKEFKKAESKLSFAVGKDIGGQVIIGDIAKMPHLLIAGTTGSGKSVFTNSIIQSILFNAEPEEVKLILIDPKVVEFSVYNGIPHLLMPVVTDPRKANTALAWAVAEMERRYKLFADHEVRGLNAYNELVAAGKITDENGEPVEALSRLVIVVDELADLMMVAGKEVEGSICRIAQLARAAGIHLVIATQRPSVDVITGLIKANMPSRVGLKCGSGIDSRTILDSVGAEKLLGYGDMLYLPQGFNKPLRVQGAFVSDEEVQKVVEFLKNNTAKEQVYDEKVIEEMNAISTTKQAEQPQEEEGDASPADDVDEYFDEACRVVVEKGKASSGMLQRVYKIGFNRAARILDQMESKGVVGPEEGTKPRKVLMTAEQLEQFIKERKG